MDSYFIIITALIVISILVVAYVRIFGKVSGVEKKNDIIKTGDNFVILE